MAVDTTLAPGPAVEPEPPGQQRRASVDWAKENLFSNWYNTVLTLLFGAAFIWAGFSAVRWVFVTAEWEIVRVNLTNFMVGRFPRDELWRIWVSTYVLLGSLGLAAGAATSTARAVAEEAGLEYETSSLVDRLRRFWPALVLVAALLALTRTFVPGLLVVAGGLVVLASRLAGLRLSARARRFSWLIVVVGVIGWLQVLSAFGGRGWGEWGGLQLTLFMTIAGIVLAFPVGVLLAMGRRSSLPALRFMSVTYIEFIRGVPLISLLLMGQFMLGFFIPEGFTVPHVVTRAVIVLTMFEAAYIAEIVRGGLQAVPRGQVEAAQAVGLSTPRVMRFVVLPQALRAVIPAMVGQFISLFKDTSLLTIIGLSELLRISEVANTQNEFLGQGLASVTLPFVGLIFWVGSYTMSRESRRLEKKLGVGER